MTDDAPWPNLEKVLARLKGFQRATARYAFRRLYEDADGQHRFLVADEVGLGKTLVARGVVALAIEHLRKRLDEVGRIDVVYICSNAEIARQNVHRLALGDELSVSRATRLTMLPRVLKDLAGRPLHFIALSPGTSFEFASSLGIAGERAVLYWMLDAVWDFGDAAGPKNLFQGHVKNTDGFRRRLKDAKAEVPRDGDVVNRFRAALEEADTSAEAAGEPTLRGRFDDLVERYAWSRQHVPADDRRDAKQFVAELRRLLARACVRALQPDLVILDEFQRFKHLLKDDTDAGMLARELFDFEERGNRARVLLLSATPYKMFTLHHEAAEDDHYADFLKTYEFLEPHAETQRTFQRDLDTYRRFLLQLPGSDGSDLRAACERVATALRRVMCRTERVRATGAKDSMLVEVPSQGVELTDQDVRTYCNLRRVADELGERRILEYWKSAPYLVSFLDGYSFDRALKQRERRGAETPLAGLLGQSGLAVPNAEIATYGSVEPDNARLRGLVGDIDRARAWELLWMPPSLQPYRLEGAYAHARDVGFTKRLIFSQWRVVPRALAALVSYEAERRVVVAAERGAVNTAEGRKSRAPLLRFARSAGRLTGMPVFGILYPSFVLADVGARSLVGDPERDLDAVLALARADIATRLSAAVEAEAVDGIADDRWYWAGAMVLDRAADSAAFDAWLGRRDLAAAIADEEDGDGDAAAGDLDQVNDAWSDHVAAARAVARGEEPLGRRPDDLADVLALLAVAGPGVTALRALVRACRDADVCVPEVRMAAARVAWGVRALMNRPESMDVVRTACRGDDESYWRSVLRYGALGGLTGVLDEHAHVLREYLGVFDESPDVAAREISQAIRDALRVRSAQIRVRRTTKADDSRDIAFATDRMRTHFAVAFGLAESDEEAGRQRDDLVRCAFNSPFWPFVLVSTSVGQEGLDFHTWCHAVIHWNLPSNPVDLEQREGRVHRYKGHAVRKNVARDFAGQARERDGANVLSDTWEHLFEAAADAVLPNDHNGLVPYWVYAPEGGARIERHVPTLPLSRDARHLVDLRRTLGAYRLVFGQPRQDDLLAYLMQEVDAARILELARGAAIDLSPRGG